MGQLGFGFNCIARSEEQQGGAVEEELFLDADPNELFIGAQRLEVYLSDNGMGWVLRLAAQLKDFDYSAFVRAYQPTGRRKRHEGVMCVRVFPGKFTTAWECGSPADWNMCVFIEKYRVETALFHSSG